MTGALIGLGSFLVLGSFAVWLIAESSDERQRAVTRERRAFATFAVVACRAVQQLGEAFKRMSVAMAGASAATAGLLSAWRSAEREGKRQRLRRLQDAEHEAARRRRLSRVPSDL